MQTSQDDGNGLLIDQDGEFVHVRLNRPEALNALSHPMIKGLRRVLQAYPDHTILVSGEGGRAFCAGGDIKAQVRAIKANDMATPKAYFADEYGLNEDLYYHEGHYVSYLNGIVMGGGYGVSAHGSHLVATEATQFAMPEVKIGFFPDVGAMYHFARLPHELGTYLALTGNTVGPADMMYVGLAQSYIPLAKFERLKAALKVDDPDQVLKDLGEVAPKGGVLETNHEVIARCFAFDDVAAILDALDRDGGAPFSLKVALAHLRAAAHEDFSAVIARDLRLAVKFLENPDFAEGVRAAVIDKDRNPRWNPVNIEGVNDNIVALYLKADAD